MLRLAKAGISILLILPITTFAEVRTDTRDVVYETASAWLKDTTAYIPCDKQHFIYGVGYIDGSYMERIFYVRNESDKPILSVRFKDSDTSIIKSEHDFESLSFVLEMKVPEAMAALPIKGGWQLAREGWETALRFKYTSWYGTIGKHDGEFQVSWQGYRRPMLPASVSEHARETCSLFEVR